jgi:hypothetical protein
MSLLTVFMLILLLAGGVLIWEARTGRLSPAGRLDGAFRGTLFFAAAVIGGALLVGTADSSLLLATALAPVTVLSMIRLVMILRARAAARERRVLAPLAVMALLLSLGVAATLEVLPRPLDQRVFIEKIFHIDTPGDSRSIDPAARRTARA